MAVINIYKNTCEVDSLYQWDNNQTLRISGLSLPQAPEVHFAHADMTEAIVRQGTMDAAGIVTVKVPNVLLEKPYSIHAYVCINTGVTFQTVCKIVIPVNGRAKPSDYEYIHEDVVLSLNALKAEMVALNPEADASVEKILNEDGTWTLRFQIPTGVNGMTYIPQIDWEGNLTWDLVRMEGGPQVWPIPSPLNLIGPPGANGRHGWTYVPQVEDGWLGWDLVRNTGNDIGLPDAIPSVYLPDLLGSSGGGMAPIDPPNSEVVGEAVQPDWNQNNPEAASYIKNRPFYTEEVEVLPEMVVLVEGGQGVIAAELTLEDGVSYAITFNGVKYQRAATFMDGFGFTVVGNMGVAGLGGDTGEPFVIATMSGQVMIMIADMAATSCTLSLAVEVVKTIPDKYLPYAMVAASDTLYWDGSFYGKEVCEYNDGAYFVKVSDAVLTEEELLNGFSTKSSNTAVGTVTDTVPGPLTYDDNGVIRGNYLTAVFVKQATTYLGVNLTPGIYFEHSGEELTDGGYAHSRALSVTVPGYGKFSSYNTLPTKLAPKQFDSLVVNNIVFRSPAGKLFTLSVSDDGAAMFEPVGVTD